MIRRWEIYVCDNCGTQRPVGAEGIAHWTNVWSPAVCGNWRKIEVCPSSESREGSGRQDGDVEVVPMRREALRQVHEHDVTWSELALRCGWWRHDQDQPDASRVKRALGINDPTKRYMRYSTAVVLADALGVDPHEAGF